ncbi:MAG: hypothetical protein VKO44_09855 [Cyanobacteriota bacterium]|nr:hypothetical protein [Cyanobacteriota bacterium]
MLASTADRGLTRVPWAALAPVQRRSRRWGSDLQRRVDRVRASAASLGGHGSALWHWRLGDEHRIGGIGIHGLVRPIWLLVPPGKIHR